MKKFGKSLIAGVLAAAMAVSMTACAGGAASSAASGTASGTAASSAADGKLEKIKFVLDYTPNTDHTGIYVAQALGYFKDAGLDVEIEQPPESGTAALVGSGNAQFGVGFQDTDMASALTSATPLPITAVAAIIQHNTSGIASVKSKNITRPKDMTNHSYATWDTPVEKGMVKYIVNKDGGDYSKVKMVPSGDNSIVQIQTNADTAWIYYGWDGIAGEVKGVKLNFFAFKDIDPVLDCYTPVIIANNAFLKKEPETAKKFMAACKKGYEYAIKDPDAAAKILIQQVPDLKSNEKLIYKSQEWLKNQYQADASQWGYITPSRWNAFYKWLYQNKLISKEIPANTGFSNDYLGK
ncbi:MULTISPECIES: ABC transporter substrate-binding protein [Caproicibacterium]|uniref:Nitrate ABC transporter substrate-binding protein n=1 Tax=Caproicibacterium lactatifermentans TaxID=2666138 RepID=A0A859DSL4_9FIRM|nr:ABC transporter substrate-binding protein [Caproicibacterium lactatifermentans]ARP49813.1 nitrate ABC transporter substrate-binding protein [Ruminococcaceae bacterium CPB6]MDD4807067.1 ABC transporter substrate-binding protein [Oscillospiraceae bacterium]QKN24459.1 nitrate ABC transporter substrate-binding protein [Caproicibacterium lactatifermentans]QKO30528.1 nitrate ABC transporter substrate-binding protein [Caproicibacterium lactatifermentans]